MPRLTDTSADPRAASRAGIDAAIDEIIKTLPDDNNIELHTSMTYDETGVAAVFGAEWSGGSSCRYRITVTVEEISPEDSP